MKKFLINRTRNFAEFTIKMFEILGICSIAYALPALLIAVIGWDSSIYRTLITSVWYNLLAIIFMFVILYAYVMKDDYIDTPRF
jgi:hypothetical protein